MADAINRDAECRGLDRVCVQAGGLFTVFFRRGAIRNLNEAMVSDTKAYASYFHRMLDQGFYLPPSQFEVSFVSMAHTEQEMSRFVEAVTT
jgi:glutamate-1-semialdehyde 2,1-aminomutase